MPTHLIAGDPNPGDLVVALGGRTGRDGIHGATFSSAELTDTHADEFSHAVQIGNAIEEKRVLDAILRARDDFDEPLFTSIITRTHSGLAPHDGLALALMVVEVPVVPSVVHTQ